MSQTPAKTKRTAAYYREYRAKKAARQKILTDHESKQVALLAAIESASTRLTEVAKTSNFPKSLDDGWLLATSKALSEIRELSHFAKEWAGGALAEGKTTNQTLDFLKRNGVPLGQAAVYQPSNSYEINPEDIPPLTLEDVNYIKDRLDRLDAIEAMLKEQDNEIRKQSSWLQMLIEAEMERKRPATERLMQIKSPSVDMQDDL